MPPTTFKQVDNNKSGTLTGAITASQTTLTLNTGQGAQFPSVFPFYCSCDYEVMLCTNRVGDVLTVTRGQDQTQAVIHNVSSLIEIREVAALWREAYTAINALEAISPFANPYTGLHLVSPVVDSGGLLSVSTGASASARFMGGTTSGAPLTGSFIAGDFIIDQTGKVYICTAAGTPGTWQQVSGAQALFGHEEFLPANLATTITLAVVPDIVFAVSRNGNTQSVAAGNYSIVGAVLTFTDAFNGSDRIVISYIQAVGSGAATTVGGFSASSFGSATPGTLVATDPVTGKLPDAIFPVFASPHMTGAIVDSAGFKVTAGNVGIGVAPVPQIGLLMDGAILSTSVTQSMISVKGIGSSAATNAIRGIISQPSTEAAAFTSAAVASLQAASPIKGAGSTITSAYGLLVDPITSGNTNNYGIYVGAPSGASGENLGALIGGGIAVSGLAPQKASYLGIGFDITATAGIGANGAPPAQVSGYLKWSNGGTAIKIPFYNN